MTCLGRRIVKHSAASEKCNCAALMAFKKMERLETDLSLEIVSELDGNLDDVRRKADGIRRVSQLFERDAGSHSLLYWTARTRWLVLFM